MSFAARVGITASGELDHGYCASFEMSATRFIVSATPRSSARRLARMAGSSAITITSSK